MYISTFNFGFASKKDKPKNERIRCKGMPKKLRGRPKKMTDEEKILAESKDVFEAMVNVAWYEHRMYYSDNE